MMLRFQINWDHAGIYWQMKCNDKLFPHTLIHTILSALYSFMIRGPVRKVLDMFLDEEQVRVVFVLGACATLGSAFVFWMPMPYKLWDIQLQQLRLLIYGELSSNFK